VAPALRDTFQVVRATIDKEARALEYADITLRVDKTFVCEVLKVTTCPEAAFGFVSKRLQ
jgi:hypothetical protein